jgi:DeoR/GlpR family transcriptional regulator of sugar metabolism
MSRKAVLRQRRLLEFIDEKQEVPIEELVALLNVSESTVRRDLDILSSDGKVIRTIGGARKIDGQDDVPPFYKWIKQHAEERSSVGKKCAEMIEDGDTIYIGGSSETYEVALHLADRTNLTIMTNSLPVMNIFARSEKIDLIALGGKLAYEGQVFAGLLTNLAFKELRADKIITDVTAIHPEYGLTDSSPPGIKVNEQLKLMGKEIIVVANYSKFGRIAPYFFADFDDISKIIVDSNVDPDIAEQLRERGVNLIIAE